MREDSRLADPPGQMMYATVLVDRPLNQSFTYAVPEGMEAKVGERAMVSFARAKTVAYVIALTEEKPEGNFTIRPIDRMIDKEPVFGEEEISLSSWLSRFYLCAPGEALSLMIPGGRRETVLPDLPEGERAEARVESLSREQETALQSINSAEKGMFYLYGVTGSGKTEVFLRAAENVIRKGRQVIYLVPEITLTHQLAGTVSGRFGGRVAILHSALSDAQRMMEWKRIRAGEVDIVIGARSAVFAPVPRLGMIVIDEEHETSYKAGESPRYHARQVAQERCRRSGAVLLMGSATPSLEAWRLAREGKLAFLELRSRVAGGVLPQVEIVDMKGVEDVISPRLEERIRATLARKKQVVLFLNRRGFSYYFHCRTCGYEMTCPRCSVSLTYHKEQNMMVCHYCGYRTRPVTVCPSCHSLDVGYSGYGTEMVEGEVKALFPLATVARIDADVAAKDRKQAKIAKILSDFKEGKIDILLGTQMVAKGLNFPGVELVGVVNADSGLSLPDFRAEERTFALLTQVSGRAGRYDDKGRVVIQTFHPEDKAIVLASEGKVKEFYDAELENRKAVGFPPYGRFVNIVLRGSREKEVIDASADLEKIINGILPAGVEVMCNDECAIAKIKTKYRRHILLRGTRPGALQAVAARALAAFKAPSGITVEADIDPLQML